MIPQDSFRPLTYLTMMTSVKSIRMKATIDLLHYEGVEFHVLGIPSNK